MNSVDVTSRNTREVLEDHLRRRIEGNLEADLGRNYDEAITTLSAEGVHHGKDGVRYLAKILRSYLPEGNYTYQKLLVWGDVGMLRWSGRCGDDLAVHDGADTYVIRAGRIAVQTIHYSSRTEARRP